MILSILIPLAVGLSIVTALASPAGDYESVKRVDAITSTDVHVTYSAEIPLNGEVLHYASSRTIHKSDLAGAHWYATVFHSGQPDNIDGSTAVGTSSAVLGDLRAKGSSAFEYSGSVTGLTGDIVHLKGTLDRVGRADAAVPLILNDQRVNVPAIRAAGRLGSYKAEFYFLDDPRNPIALRWQVGDNRLTVVRIAYPLRMRRVAASLSSTGRAVVYGITFDFASDRLTPESKALLDEIADSLKQHPGWKLRIEGYTDSVGGDAYNVDLSKRRADAVKNALVQSYSISAGRLVAVGLGASHPKDTNATLEGRARNRRVELVRIRA